MITYPESKESTSLESFDLFQEGYLKIQQKFYLRSVINILSR